MLIAERQAAVGIASKPVGYQLTGSDGFTWFDVAFPALTGNHFNDSVPVTK